MVGWMAVSINILSFVVGLCVCVSLTTQRSDGDKYAQQEYAIYCYIEDSAKLVMVLD
jgi:ABC-type arginine/histidine transport system permease subunit